MATTLTLAVRSIPNLDSTEHGFALQQSFLGSLNSEHSRTSYLRAIAAFAKWSAAAAPGLPLSRILVLRFRAAMIEARKSSATINLRLAALRHLAEEAELLGLLTAPERAGIAAVRGVKMQGVRSGNWLTNDQTNKVLSQPDRMSLKGVRDFAILAVLFSCGLRRAELTALRVTQFVLREGRTVFLDVRGKGNRLRTIPVPGFTRDAIQDWLDQSHISDGRIFRAINKSSKVQGSGLSPEAVLQILQFYADQAGFPDIRPHDARRTCAKMCRKSEGPLEEIQQLLGHASILTTMRYIGDDKQLQFSVNDRLQFQPK